jgi:hypothetical protein
MTEFVDRSYSSTRLTIADGDKFTRCRFSRVIFDHPRGTLVRVNFRHCNFDDCNMVTPDGTLTPVTSQMVNTRPGWWADFLEWIGWE